MRTRYAKPLSARETQVVELACSGLSNREIARELGLAEGTIKGYTNYIFNKTGASNRVELVNMYLGRTVYDVERLKKLRAKVASLKTEIQQFTDEVQQRTAIAKECQALLQELKQGFEV